jgi:hypothetical protein
MGRLVIAHHKSYHPYKRDNIERVKRDEELAELEEQRAEGRIQLADAEARIHLLRERAGVDKDTKRKKRQTVEDEFADAERAAAAPAAQASGLPLSGGHINFFEDLEHVRLLISSLFMWRLTHSSRLPSRPPSNPPTPRRRRHCPRRTRRVFD